METTRLIMLEGLPGTGKSTNSYFLSMQLEGEGKKIKYIHEAARAHPVLLFDEASLTYGEYHSFLTAHPHAEPSLHNVAVFGERTIRIDLLALQWNGIDAIGMNAFQALREYDLWHMTLDRYTAVALDKWADFTEKTLEREDDIYILDSCIFQFQIFTFLLKNAPYVKIEQFVLKLVQIINPLNPNLIYFYRENVQDTIDFLEKLRGKQFMARIWERDRNEPYYIDKPTGAEGQKHFLRDYAGIARQLFDKADCRKEAIEITNQDWTTYENALLSFLRVDRKVYPDVLPPNGTYRNEALNQEIRVQGLLIVDPTGLERTLTPKSDCEFYVECLPVILCFVGQNQIEIAGGQIRERWTTSGTLFEAVRYAVD